MTYKEAEAYIEKIQCYGSVQGLDSIRELCTRLGNPQDQLPFVHIAGTNGKGSVLAYISTILKAAGYKTGRYLSPTILEYRERIQINGHMISRGDFCKYLERAKGAADSMMADGMGHPTTFEIDTAMAFDYFADKECDIVVLETGLGGTYDATNIIRNTLVAVITPVSKDHTDILGKTLTAIGENKAGIIKNGCLVVSAFQEEEVTGILQEKCRQMGCTMIQSAAGEAVGVKYGLEKQRFSYGAYKNMEIAMAGMFQIENAILALDTIKALEQKGFPVTEKKLRQGLNSTCWPGRFQILDKKPVFVIDGAHNEGGAKQLAASIDFYFTNKRIIYIMGILRDKSTEKIIELTHSYAEQIITVTPPVSRGLHAYDLAVEVQRYHNSVTAADSLEEAAELAYLLADKDSVIIAFGSISYLGALMKVVENRRNGNGRSKKD